MSGSNSFGRAACLNGCVRECEGEGDRLWII